MNLAQIAVKSFLVTASASAFSPSSLGGSAKYAIHHRNSVTRKFASNFHTSTVLNANVLKLTEPDSQLLSNVDVFIFDCDGVIWRVSHDNPSH
jgi:hypothetical protein